MSTETGAAEARAGSRVGSSRGTCAKIDQEAATRPRRAVGRERERMGYFHDAGILAGVEC
jgi:hypothetical protein